jgi:hypothetical protein
VSDLAELCADCFPLLEELVQLALRARSGEHAVPVVGDGSPDTQVGCAHGSWRLGDVLTELEGIARACTETTKDGAPCKGRAGDDGRCAAHKDAP